MCEFCTKHGEGKKWYLNVKNYSSDLLSDLRRRKLVIGHFYWIDRTIKWSSKLIDIAPLKTPIIGYTLKKIIKRYFLSQKWAQVVPIEDVEKILSFTNSITRVSCTCRAVKTGKEHRTCFLISLKADGKGIADIVDQSYYGGPDLAKFEKINQKIALELMKENERKGMIHTVWALKPPFIGAICNCDFNTGCAPMAMQRKSVTIFFKAEYMAKSDEDKCIGCKECIKICPFNAINFDSHTKKIEINIEKCFGCGLCRTVCKKDAIILKDRISVPGAVNLW